MTIIITSDVKWNFTLDRASFSKRMSQDKLTFQWKLKAKFWEISENVYLLKTISTDLQQAKPELIWNSSKRKTVPCIFKVSCHSRSFTVFTNFISYFVLSIFFVILRYDFKLNVFETGKYSRVVCPSKKKKRSLPLVWSFHDCRRIYNVYKTLKDKSRRRESPEKCLAAG